MAHEYRAGILWTRNGAPFTDNRYSRAHLWRFDEGLEVPASSSPLSVRLPFSRADAVDPEEAFVAALASCHMLFFLNFAALGGFVVDRYDDTPVGVMTKNRDGKLYMSKITLNPSVTFTGAKHPTEHDVGQLHHRSHEECYIANSVRTDVVIDQASFAVT
jgi:organic hydroperoxide reductase OsmC/OhrA